MAADFIINKAGQAIPASKGQLALGPQNFRMAPPNYQLPSRALTVPGTGFTMGASGPTISAGRPPITPPSLQPQLRLPGPVSTPTPSLLSRGGSLLKRGGMVGLPSLAGNVLGSDPTEEELETQHHNALFRGLFNVGEKFKAVQEGGDAPGIISGTAGLMGDTLQAPVKLETSIARGVDATFDFVGDNLFKSRNQLNKENEEEALREQEHINTAYLAGQENIEDLTATTQIGQALQSGLASDSRTNTPIDLGPAQTEFGELDLPAPPGPTDYSGVQAAIDHTKPTYDEEGFQKRRRGAILMAMAGGALQAAMESDNDFNAVLGGIAMGAMKGHGIADKNEAEAKKEFKQAIDQYWIRTAGVKKAEAENDAQYNSRVWETKVKQLGIDSAARMAQQKASGGTLRQAGDKFYITGVSPDGKTNQLIPVDMGTVNRGAGMLRSLKEMGIPADQAKSMVADTLAGKSPEYALQKFTLASMKENGRYLNFIEELSDPKSPRYAEEFADKFQNAGQITLGLVTDEKQSKKLADQQRDALLLDMISNSPALFLRAMQHGEVR